MVDNAFLLIDDEAEKIPSSNALLLTETLRERVTLVTLDDSANATLSPLASPFGRRLALSVGAASLRVAMPQALRCANTSRRDSWKPTWVRWFTRCYNGGKIRNALAPEGKAIDIDVGLIDFAVTSDGSKHQNPKHLIKIRTKLKAQTAKAIPKKG